MDVPSAIPLEVDSIADLARWIISSSADQRGTLYLVSYKGKFVLCSMTNFANYYNNTGLPVLLFTYLQGEPSNPFLRFDIRIGSKNQVSFVAGFDENEANLGYIQYIPIIKLKTVPSIFNFESK